MLRQRPLPNGDALNAGERTFPLHLDAQGQRFDSITDAVLDGDPWKQRDCAPTVLQPEDD